MNKLIWTLTSTILLLTVAYSDTDAQSCATDSECERGQICITSDEDQGGGECKPRPILCNVDTDCPEGLLCVEQEEPSCVNLSDGASSCETNNTNAESSVCEYVVLQCTNDDDCFEGYACTRMGGLQKCTNTGCSPVENKICFPRRIDCVNVDDCAAGSDCYTFPPSDRQSAPPGWEDITSACIPDGIVLAFQGAVPTNTSRTTHYNPSTEDSEPESNSGSCSVNAASAGSKSSVLFITAMLLLLIYRRLYNDYVAPNRGE